LKGLITGKDEANANRDERRCREKEEQLLNFLEYKKKVSWVRRKEDWS
jgi:hypothetical protein